MRGPHLPADPLPGRVQVLPLLVLPLLLQLRPCSPSCSCICCLCASSKTNNSDIQATLGPRDDFGALREVAFYFPDVITDLSGWGWLKSK